MENNGILLDAGSGCHMLFQSEVQKLYIILIVFCGVCLLKAGVYVLLILSSNVT